MCSGRVDTAHRRAALGVYRIASIVTREIMKNDAAERLTAWQL